MARFPFLTQPLVPDPEPEYSVLFHLNSNVSVPTVTNILHIRYNVDPVQPR